MSIKKNFIYNSAYQILCLITPLATSPYLSRVLGAEQLGVYSFSYSVSSYFVLFAMLGINNYGNRSIARVRGDRKQVTEVFWGIYVFQLLMTLVVAIVYLIYTLSIADNMLISLLWLPYVVSAGLDINWFFFGLEEFKTTVTRNFIIKLSTVLLIFIAVRGEYALIQYCLILSTSYFVSAAILWPFTRKYIGLYLPSLKEVFSHLIPNVVLFVPVIANSFFTVFDKVLLGSLSSYQQSGYFENAQKVAVMPFSLISALGTVMLPRSSNLLANGKVEEAKRYLGISVWFAMLLSSAFTFGLIGVSDVFTPVFFGPGYAPCSILIAVLAAEMPFMSWGNVIRTQYLIPSGRDKAYLVSVAAAAFLNVGIVIILIPKFGALGASLGGLVAQITVCFVQSWYVRSELSQLTWIRENIIVYIIGFVMCILVKSVGQLLRASLITLVVQIIVGAVFYVLACIAVFEITDNVNYKHLINPILQRLKVRRS